MLRDFESQPPAGYAAGLGDPRNLQSFTSFTHGTYRKTIEDLLGVLLQRTNVPIPRQSLARHGNKSRNIALVLHRLLEFKDTMMEATSTKDDLGGAKMFVDDIHEVLSIGVQIFNDDIFHDSDGKRWISRQSAWALLKALSEWHDHVGTHIALHLLPTFQFDVRPCFRYMNLQPWDNGPETDITIAYREVHRTVRNGPTEGNDISDEMKSMVIG
ncbi:hypothetical protein LTR95_005288 [Oleoguttula sp. CCFEE 5521]